MNCGSYIYRYGTTKKSALRQKSNFENLKPFNSYEWICIKKYTKTNCIIIFLEDRLIIIKCKQNI